MIDTLAKITLAPLLVAQALQVRRRALILPEPPGPRQGRIGTGAPLRLLILGDSSAAGVGATDQARALSGQLGSLLSTEYALDWRLLARTGDTTRNSLHRLQTIEDTTKFDVAIIAIGVNDVTRSVPLPRWLAGQRALHDTLRERHGTRLILRSGLPPMGHFPLLPQPLRWTMGRTARRFNTALAGLCAGDPDLTHVPLDLPFDAAYVAEDGFHPSEPAYRLWAGLLAQELRDHPTLA
ncbi:SGNH/GDSL hydrolase family protein [Marimonas lutisalis]|uniref:SGNH/GDSL hydrolase family protein n=1 Tax=Marimonas lutisalis TaxID=2545756 RepID=UPI0010F8F300|nr:SGNH/GDSL hydrolase family protein [Marimonas lutisalis]